MWQKASDYYLRSMHQLSLWKFIVQKLTFHHPVILLCVVESNGSSPGRQGFKMAVSENEMVGSIGGGIMEHKFVELAKERLQQGSSASFIRKQFHQKSAAKDQSGMICSGEQTVLLYLLAEKDLPVIHRIVSALENNNTGLLKITFSEFEFVDSNYQEDDHGFNMRSETDFTYTERIGFKNHLYIIGGGHCALALSKLMSGMDFYIHLFEERENLNTMVENNFVHEKIMVNDYSELAALIPDGNSHPAGRAAPAGCRSIVNFKKPNMNWLRSCAVRFSNLTVCTTAISLVVIDTNEIEVPDKPGTEC